MKKILSFILALLMTVAILPIGSMGVSAAEPEDTDRAVIEVYNTARGEGTISFLSLLEQYTPEATETADDGGEDTYVEPVKPQMKNPLQKNTTYKLMEDIDLGGIELTGAITAVYEEYKVEVPPTEEGGETATETKKRVVSYEGTGFIELVDGVIIDGQGHSIVNFTLAGSKNVSLFNAQTGNGAAADIEIKDISFGTKSSPVIYAHNGETQHNQKGMALIHSTDSPTTIRFKNVNAFVDGTTVGGAWQEHGVFVGRNWGTLEFDSCKVDGNMTTHGYFGSFVSIVKNNPVTFKNCVNSLDVTVKGSGWLGGFVGKTEGSAKLVTVSDCTNVGAISGERATGGFIGEVIYAGKVEIINSANHASVSGKTRGVGGAVGVVTSGKLLVDNFVNSGAVTATGAGSAGSLLGYAEGAYVNLEIDRAVNGGAVTAKSGSAGGAVGNVASTAGNILINDFVNLSKISATAYGAAGVGNASSADSVNDMLTVEIARLVNTADVYGKLGAGAAVGNSASATLSVIYSISSGAVSADKENADVFARFEADTENDIPDAIITAVENIYVIDAKTNDLGAEKYEAQAVYELLTNSENGYTVCDFSLDVKGARVTGDIRPVAEGVQTSKDTAKGTVRLVGTVHSLNFAKLGFSVSVDGGAEQRIFTKNVYRELVSTDAEGSKELLEAWELGGAYVFAVELDLPASGEHTVKAVPVTCRSDGTEFEGFEYTLKISDGAVVVNDVNEPEYVEIPGAKEEAEVFSSDDVQKLETYQSNTIAATGNNGVLTSTSLTTKRYRAIFKAQEYGELEYSLMFSNNVDSTWGGSSSPTCTPETQAHPYKIVYAKLGVGTDVTANMKLSVDLTFGGEAKKTVRAGEIYWSDPVTLNVPKDEMIIFEWEVEYDLIPATNICGTFLGATYSETVDAESGETVGVYSSTSYGTVPLPDLIGAKRENEVRMAFLGDSITMGQGAGSATYKFYAAQVTDLVGKDVSCWNLGLGYARANDLLYSRAWLEKAKQNDIVVVCLGTNDVNSGTYLDADRSTEEIYADILAICQELESAGCEIILLSTPPFGYSNAAKKQTCLALGEQLSALAEARGYDFINTVALWGTSGDMATSKYPASSSDYHPNSLGCEVLAQAFVNQGIIEPALPDIDSDFPFVKDEDEEYGQSPIVRPSPGDIIK